MPISPISQIMVEIPKSGSIPALVGTWTSWTAQTLLSSCVGTATAIPGFSCPNPITRSFDTDSDTDPDPDPELASPLDFSDNLKLGPETYTYPYTYTAKRYTFTYTMMR
ncbi:MAG: hypothetical protein ACOX52_19955 [Verrucomicrobiota bacterium]